jgi:thiol-disulfide isomerase/thioredoxin
MNIQILYGRVVFIFIFMTAINLGFNSGKAQNMLTEEKQENGEDTTMIIGRTTLDELSGNLEFWNQYNRHYIEYAMDDKIIQQIGVVLQNRAIRIVLVIGTWCGDTKEQFPVLQKIIDNLNPETIFMQYIGVDRDKLAGTEDISFLGIQFIPTFIFYEKEEELGRIVEIPEGTMEENVLNILSKRK